MRLIIDIFFMLSFSLSIPTFGCGCKNIKPLDSLSNFSFHESDIVFLGELIEIDTVNYTFTFEIIEKFKGEYRDTIVHGKSFDSCSKFPRDKSLWIVYATFKGNIIDISQCSASRSELNPICLNCYEIPSPSSIEIEKQTFEKEMSLLKIKAQNDLKDEIEFLRHQRN